LSQVPVYIVATPANIVTLALFSAVRPDGPQTSVPSGTVRLTDQASDLPAPATAPPGPQSPQTVPNMVGRGGVFAADQPDPDWNADPGWDFQSS
jgi:hypothetical protein